MPDRSMLHAAVRHACLTYDTKGMIIAAPTLLVTTRAACILTHELAVVEGASAICIAELLREGCMRRALLFCCGLFMFAGMALSGCAHEQVTERATDADGPRVYDERADARVQIDDAIRAAARDDKRVLLVFGGNWCSWCVKLHKLFDENREIGQLLDQEYTTAWIDVDQLEKHADLAKQYAQLIDDHGVPFLAVLGADGEQLSTQDTEELEEGDHHDPDKVLEFLRKW